MKTLLILVLGVLLGAAGLGIAVKTSPDVQKVLFHHSAAVTCECAGCDCDPCTCANCTCTKCAGKAAAKPCCPDHK